MATKNTPVIKCFLQEGLLLKNTSRKLLKAEIISVQSYKGFPLSLQIMVENKYLFSDIKPESLASKNDENSFGEFNNRPYSLSVDYDIDCYVIETLVEKEVTIFVDKCRFFGTYLFTVDFFTKNEQVHLIKTDYGSFIFVPNHKIIFEPYSGLSLQEFKKL